MSRELTPVAGENLPTSSLKRTALSWGGPVLVALVFLALTAWTWRRWPDLLVDFGRELYLPWQLASGKVLYRDLAYLNGPLSPYLNALWFRIFGTSLTTLIFCNLAILGLITGLVYLIIKKSCGIFEATLVSITFLCLSAFAQLDYVANYNYVCPYSHEMTHGIFLSLLLIIFLSSSISRPRPAAVIAAGLCLGLIFLGKGEIFLAAAGAATVGLAFLGATNEIPRGKFLRLVMIFMLAALAPAGIFLIYFLARMPLALALKGIAGTWTGLLGTNVAHNFFYQKCMGLDQPWHNVFLMVKEFFGIALVSGMLIVADLACQSFRTRSMLVCLAAILFLGAISLENPRDSFLLFNRSMPLTLLAATGTMIVLCLRHRVDKAKMARLAPLAIWAVLGMGLLAKMILNARVWQYGFVLAMPAVILIAVLLVGLIPEALRGGYGRGGWLRLFAAVAILLDVSFALQFSDAKYSQKDLSVGTKGDAIITFGTRASPIGPAVLQLLDFIQSAIPTGANFAVLPEGVMVNYLTRHLNPTRFINFMPPELIIFGETRILNAFQNQPPDFIILIPKNTEQYGEKPFGTSASYGKKVMDWISNKYTPIWQSTTDTHFVIKVLKRLVG